MIGTLITTGDSLFPRAVRLTVAAEEALQRVTPLVGADLFGPIGECLMWLVTLDDALLSVAGYETLRNQDPDGSVLPGIRYARNAFVHGELVVTTLYVNPGAMLGAMVLGTAMLGQGPFIGWVARSAINHVPKSGKYLSQQEQSYDAEIAGHDVIAPLQRAFSFLRNAAGT